MSTKTEEESFDSGSRGSEYESSTDRINNSLEKIRSELTEIRDQDLKLLKQLIKISETIKRLSEDRLSKRRTWYGQRQSLCSESAELYLDIEPLTPDLEDYRDAILVRQFSEPVSFSRDDLLDIRPSLSIFDAPVSLDLEDTIEENWPPTFSRVQLRHRPHSVSILTSSRSFGMEGSQERLEGSDKSYEEILQRNIRLWKVRHSVHTSDDEEDRVRTPVNDWSFLTPNGHKNPINLADVSDKKKRDSGSSSSSVIHSSGSSYSSSAVNGGSSRSSCSSCSSCVFNGVNIVVGETMVPEVAENGSGDGGNVVAENSDMNMAGVAEPAKNNITLDNDAVVDGYSSSDLIDFRDSKTCKDGGNDEPNFWNDGDLTPVIDIGETRNVWMHGESVRNGEGSSDKGAEGGEDLGVRILDERERGALIDVARSVSEGAKQLSEGAAGITRISGAGEEFRPIEKGAEIGMEADGDLERRGEGHQIRDDETASGGKERGRSREREKESDRDRGKDVAGGGDKPKRKDSGGGVVRALLDHIGRKIENRVTVGMAEYSRSFLPVISEMSKKDGRQKAGSHRPRELDIT